MPVINWLTFKYLVTFNLSALGMQAPMTERALLIWVMCVVAIAAFCIQFGLDLYYGRGMQILFSLGIGLGATILAFLTYSVLQAYLTPVQVFTARGTIWLILWLLTFIAVIMFALGVHTQRVIYYNRHPEKYREKLQRKAVRKEAREAKQHEKEASDANDEATSPTQPESNKLDQLLSDEHFDDSLYDQPDMKAATQTRDPEQEKALKRLQSRWADEESNDADSSK